jgi:type IV pilus assembly protein PilB
MSPVRERSEAPERGSEGDSGDMAVKKFDKRLMTILSRRKAVADEVLGQCLAKAEEGDSSLTQVLLEQKVVDEPTLLTVLSEETHLAPISVAKITPDEDLTHLLQENLAQYYGVLPVSKISNLLTLAVSNPFDILLLDDLKTVTGCEIRPVLSTDVSIKKAIPDFYKKGEQMVQEFMDGIDENDLDVQEKKVDVEDISDLSAETEKAPVVKLVNLIVFQGIQKKASDIHIEPLEKRVRVRYRLDGVLQEAMSPPKKMIGAIASRIKIMCGLDIAEKRKPQDGKFQMKISGRTIDFRVSTLPIIHGEKIVLRILDSSNLALSLDSLGLETKALTDIRQAISQPYGMLLVTGPTGSGKSTTLYSSIREVLSVEDNITTVEDPVEYQLEGVNQVQVNPKSGLTFATALRSLLRQDPDTILLGEIRDKETVEIAIKAALTGHLVFSTLHTNDAPSTITRITDMGIDPFLVASSVQCVCAQRLGRKLCEECKKPAELLPPPDRLIQMGFLPEEVENLSIFEPVGCPRCAAGYKGRFAIVETLPITNALQRVIISGASAIDIKVTALADGMMSLRRAAILNVLKGRTSIEEILRSTIAD